MTTGEGGMIVPGGAEVAARLRSERNQGRAADMGWLDHGGLGFNYRLSDLAAALGVAQLERLDAMLERRAAVASLYAQGLAGIEGVETPIAAPRRGAAQLVRLPGPPRRRGRPRRDRSPASPSAASPRKAYLPCIHLFPHLRELGYREGQFPVAEAASARSLALPFFPAMTESQVRAGVRGSRRIPAG